MAWLLKSCQAVRTALDPALAISRRPDGYVSRRMHELRLDGAASRLAPQRDSTGTTAQGGHPRGHHPGRQGGDGAVRPAALSESADTEPRSQP